MISKTASTYRNAFGGLSKSTWLLSWIMLINRSGTMVVPFMTLYLTSHEMGFTVSDAGFVFALFGAGAFSGAWLGGKLTDRFGFYPVQLFTLFGGGILFITLGQMKSYELICLFTFLLSFVNEAFRPANSTAIAFYSAPENRTRSYALNRLAINLGWAAGSALGGLIAHFDYELLFWVDGFTNIAAGFMMWLWLHPGTRKHITHTKAQVSAAIAAYKDKTYLIFIATVTVFAACFFQIFTNLPVYFKKDLHFSEPYIGMLMAINGIVIALVEMILVYKLEGKKKSMYFISTGVFLVGLSFLLLDIPVFPAVVSLSMIILISLGEILSMPFMNSYWLSRSSDVNRGQYAALYTMAWSFAQTFGPWAGSVIAGNAGFRVLWICLGITCIIAAFSFRKMLHREIRPVQNPPLL